MEESYTTSAGLSAGMQQADASREPNIVESLVQELAGLRGMLGELGGELHAQADRLLGQEPSPPEGNRAISEKLAGKQPSFFLVKEEVEGLRRAINNARNGVRRLRKIG